MMQRRSNDALFGRLLFVMLSAPSSAWPGGRGASYDWHVLRREIEKRRAAPVVRVN